MPRRLQLRNAKHRDEDFHGDDDIDTIKYCVLGPDGWALGIMAHSVWFDPRCLWMAFGSWAIVDAALAIVESMTLLPDTRQWNQPWDM